MSPSTDPVKYPTIKLGDKEYEVKFRLSDFVNLQKTHGIDLFVKTETKGVAALERMALVIQAGIAHAAALTVDDIMDAIEIGEIPTYALAVAEAQKKASPAAQRALKALEAMVPKEPKPKAEPVN
jgi:SpoU rRNA methylase family enzyme